MTAAVALMTFTVGVSSDLLRSSLQTSLRETSVSITQPVSSSTSHSTDSPSHTCVLKRRCRICSPHNFCIHDRRKESCGLCGGKYYCQHNKRKVNCIECGGKGLCVHKIIKGSCNICLGPNYCEHKKKKRQCPQCRDARVTFAPTGKKWGYSSKRWLDRISTENPKPEEPTTEQE